MIIYIILLFIIFFLFFTSYIETYQNNQSYKPLTNLSNNHYLDFLSTIHLNFKSLLPQSSSPLPQQILCNDTTRKEILSSTLSQSFDSLPEQDCAHKALKLCEFTNPLSYIPQNTQFPPKWTFKPYKDIPPPKHINLKCWNNMLNCCKKNIL